MTLRARLAGLAVRRVFGPEASWLQPVIARALPGIGVVLATVLGTMIGIARLSSNWLLSRLAAVYVEALRDLPLLLQLLFWYVLMQGLPAARAAWLAPPAAAATAAGVAWAVVRFAPLR